MQYNDAGTTSFSVSNAGTGTMPWTAAVTTGGSWLSITSGASGTDTGTIQCCFTANAGSLARTGTLLITAINATGSPVEVTVTQAPTTTPTSKAPVPDTGQTKCYNFTKEIPCPSPGQPYYGQDANYTINPMSYTKLDSSGNDLPDSASSWVTVRDNVTGLIWEMKTNKDGVKNYNDPHDSDNTYTWYDSNPNTGDFIKQLNEAHYGGFNDWRLPTNKELGYIVNYSIPYSDIAPTIDSIYFPNTQNKDYWSATASASRGDYAWCVSFDNGTSEGGYKFSNCFVRAVCGGQPWVEENAFINNGDGTITDTVTGLMWQQKCQKTTTWDEALDYCENLSLGGHTDWRLPTIKELWSIVDYRFDSPAINKHYFSNVDGGAFVSSTTYTNSPSDSWEAELYFGAIYGFSSSKRNGLNVLAVRGGQASPKPPTLCTASIDGSLLLHIPYISYVNTKSETNSLWANFVYEPNPTLILFKLTNAGIISNPSFSCTASTLSSDLKIHIPDLLLPDGRTRLWVDMEYFSTFSSDSKTYFVVENYGNYSK